MEAFQQIFAIALVLALLFACLFWLRKRGFAYGGRAASHRGGAFLNAVERLPLSPGASLHLVRVGDRALIVAVSPGGCRRLACLPWSELQEGGER